MPVCCIVSSLHLQMFDWTIWGEIAKTHMLRLAIRLPNGVTFNTMLPFQNLDPREVSGLHRSSQLKSCCTVCKPINCSHQLLFRLMPSHGAHLFAKLGFCCCRSGKKQRWERTAWKWQLIVACQLALSLFLRVSCKSLFFQLRTIQINGFQTLKSSKQTSTSPEPKLLGLQIGQLQ